MNEQRDYTVYAQPGAQPGSALAIRNKALRQTYTLLAISLIPTVLGAWVGMATGLNVAMAESPGMTMIIFLVGAFGLMFGIERTKNSSAGVGLLLLFTFFMGVMLSQMLGFVLGMGNGPQLVMLAFGGTAIIFGAMSTLANVVKRDLTGLSKMLFVGVILLMIAGIANIWLQLPALMLTFSVVAIIIFSAFMLVDVQRVINGGETNYITATLAIYLDLYNVFVNLLALLGIFGGERR